MAAAWRVECAARRAFEVATKQLPPCQFAEDGTPSASCGPRIALTSIFGPVAKQVSSQLGISEAQAHQAIGRAMLKWHNKCPAESAPR